MRSLFLLAVVFTFLSLAGEKAADGVAPDKATFSPGKEVKIVDPETGGLGYYIVYTPKDYKPEREYPTIFCFHGKGGSPTSWPFKEATDGQNYIIIGLDYKDHENPSATADVENVKRIRKFIETKLKINSKLVFFGGFSQGGWSTSSFSNLYIDNLAGLLIMGAGGQPGDKTAKKIKNMPVFVGVGEKDDVNDRAKACRDAYKAKGAEVTFEEFPGLGHSADPKNKALKEWLLKHGPQNQMMASLASAKAAEKGGKLGEAFNFYSQAASMNGGKEAEEPAKAISDAATAKLTAAEAAITAKKYDEAAKLFASVADTYAASPFAEKAQERLKFVKSDPTVKANIEQAQLDTKADALEAQAQGAEKSKEYAKALEALESYIKQYPKATRFAAVKAHYDELKVNKAVQTAATSQLAERECKGLLSTADNYIKNGSADSARPYLEKIMEKYAGTDWASEAKKRLAQLK